MLNIEITIEGVSPLICARFSDEAAERASSGNRSSAAASDRGTPLEIAEKCLYTGLDGKVMLPQPNVLRCLVDGGRFFKAGKKQITTKEESMLYGCLDIDGAEIPISHKQPWKVDTRAVVIPATKGRILAHRPMFDDWRLSFMMELDISVISEKLLREIVDAAGKRVGLGAFRPAKKGPYGRFVVNKWEI
jgi:hypothetical protein